MFDFVRQVVSAMSPSAFYTLTTIVCFFFAVPEIHTRDQLSDPCFLSVNLQNQARISSRARRAIAFPKVVGSTSPYLRPEPVIVVQVAHSRSNCRWKTIVRHKVLDASKVKHFILDECWGSSAAIWALTPSVRHSRR